MGLFKKTTTKKQSISLTPQAPLAWKLIQYKMKKRRPKPLSSIAVSVLGFPTQQLLFFQFCKGGRDNNSYLFAKQASLKFRIQTEINSSSVTD